MDAGKSRRMKRLADIDWVVTAVEICGKIARATWSMREASRKAAAELPHSIVLTENVFVQEVVAEFSGGVELFG